MKIIGGNESPSIPSSPLLRFHCDERKIAVACVDTSLLFGQCASTPLIIMGKVPRKENVHLCLFSYTPLTNYTPGFYCSSSCFLLPDPSPFSNPSFRRVSTSIPQLFLTSPLLINISRAAYHRLLANCDTSSRGSQSAWSSK